MGSDVNTAQLSKPVRPLGRTKAYEPTRAVAAAPVATSATVGKTVYAANCAMCHTATPALNISKVLKGANSPTIITNAINNNVGGMGFLKGTISAQDANNLAAYLATPGI